MIIPVKIDEEAAAAAAAQAGSGSTSSCQEELETGKGEGFAVPTWSMVELQGELISKDPLSGQSLGTMTFENGKPALVIGNHRLEGKVASEPKPLLVLRKVVVCADGDGGAGSGVRSEVAAGGEGGDGVARPQRVEYRVVGRVTRKTIFKTRPKPLIRKIDR